MIYPFEIATFFGFASASFVLLRLLRRAKQAKQAKAVRRPAIVRRRVTAAGGSSTSTNRPWERLEDALARVIDRADIRAAPANALLLSVCLATAHGAAAVVFAAPVWLVIVICLTTFVFIIGVFYFLMVRRITKFTRQFPVALELLARATRAGESIERAFAVASGTSDAPLKSEFARCVQQMRLGQTPVRSAEDLAQRIPTTDVSLLADVLSMHMEVGGRLAESLERLAKIIRERVEFQDQMRSTTGIARFAVLAVTLIGLFVFVYLQIVQPEYLARLGDSPLGRKMIAYGVASEVAGMLWVGMTLRSDF